MKVTLRFRQIVVFLQLLTLFSFAGCASLSGRIRVGVAIGAFDDSSMADTRNRIMSYFSEISTDDVEFLPTFLDGKHDASEQLLNVDEFIERGYEVMIVDLVIPSLASTITEKAKAAGVPVVYLHHQPGQEDMDAWDKTCFVGFDDSQAGTAQGEIIADLPNNGDANGDGVVSYVMITGNPVYADTQYRVVYPIKALTDRGIEVEELLKQSADWDETQGYDIMADAISQFGDRIDVVFCHSDPMAVGAQRAISEAGRTVNKDIYLVGWDARYDGVDMVNNGLITGTVGFDNDSLAVAAVDAAVKFLQGKKNEQYIWIDCVSLVAESVLNNNA